jgi:hypothetical protein
MVVILLIGMGISYGFSALAALSRRERLRVALAESAGFLEAVRRNAMAHSISCMVNITTSGEISVAEIPSNTTSNRCLPSMDNAATGIQLRELTNDPSLTASLSNNSTVGFSFKGTSLSDTSLEILISSGKTADFSYCLAITTPLGFIRTGRKLSSITPCEYTQ